MDKSILFFSLKILSGSSLHFVIIRGIYTCVRMECEESVFQNRAGWWLGLATWLSLEFKLRVNWMANLDFLFYSATASMMVQLLCMLRSCASSGGLPVASYSRDLVTSPCFNAQSWVFLHTLSHTIPLHDSHLNTGFLSPKLQANWHEIKSTKWLIKFNLTISPFGYSVTKP